MNFSKKLIAVTVFSLMLLPAQFAQAQVVLANPDQLIKNVQNAQSVDFSVNIDIKTSSSVSERSNAVHIDLKGVADADRISAFDANFSSTVKQSYNEDGKKEVHQGSVVITPETLYFSEDGVWYFIKQNAAYDLPTEKEMVDGAANFKAYMQEMFNRGVITYRMESVEFVNGKLAVRYGYTVNYDKFITYLLEKRAITEYQAKEARASARGVTIGGQFWVDTAAMLPVMLTLNVSGNQSASEHGNLQASISFNSFNQPVNITEPKNAISFEEYHAVKPVAVVKPAPVVATRTITVAQNSDTDGDGLTNADEKVLWKTNPNSADTDGDGYADKTEVTNGYNPNGAGKLDSDHDGLSDYDELTVFHSDRYNSDSDGDSHPDGLEVWKGYNPIGPGRK